MQARLTAVAVIVVVVDIVVHLVCARPELGIPPPIVRTSTSTASPAARPTAESPQLTAPLSHAPNSATPPPIAVTSAQWRGPRALPRCGPHTPGAWVGEQWPKTWVFDANACAYTVSTPFDFLAAFAGKRLLVVGDSVSRELAVDTMRVVAGCGTFEPLRYTTAPLGAGAAIGGAAGAALDASCASLMFGRGAPDGWRDVNVTLPVGSTGAAVDLRFYWLQWPTQLADKWWWRDVVLAGDFDAAVFNSYLHVAPGVPSAPEWYDAQLDWFVGELRDAGARDAALAAKLRRRVFWRATLPVFGRFDVKPEALAASLGVADAKLTAAGHTVVALDKYVDPSVMPFDGAHPPVNVALAMAWELWSVIADAIADEAVPPATSMAAPTHSTFRRR